MADSEQNLKSSQKATALTLPEYTQWYFLSLEERVSIVENLLKDRPEKLIQFSKEIGINTGTTTGFGRSYDILQASLPFIRAGKQGSSIKVLDIGPGMGMPSVVEMCHHLKLPVKDPRTDRQFSSEPFEIISALQANGFSNVELTAFDIDPLVTAIIKSQKNLVVERFLPNMKKYYLKFIQNTDPDAEPILATEIKEVNARNTKYPEEHFRQAHLVELPTRITEAVNIQQGDITELSKNKDTYDLVYYLAVDIYVDDKEKALRNVVAKVRKGGMLITSEINEPSSYGLKEVTRVPWIHAKVCYEKISPESK